MARLAVAAPQWRISTDRTAAARAAAAAGADQLHLDFGGAHRGPPLGEPGRLREAAAVAADLPVPVLAVNHVNDLGLADDRGAVPPAVPDLLARALDCAHRLGARVLHVPAFRRSLPLTGARRHGVVGVLRALGEQVRDAGLTLAFESPLDAGESVALAREVDCPALRLVLDTGNLLDAGADPSRFARTVLAAGLLQPDLHVKDPGPPVRDPWPPPAPGAVRDGLRELLREAAARSVLVENDYLRAPERLRTDISLCRRAAGPGDKEER
ncbi:sugar phosphate isomerase/epimerase family protein [Streptomyces rubiginosohelvolus]|uniref:sugar phosphate isomerase/epimerase family protein n=1 Tax=Streptomyces rubiginosohelvolus TaxID=67362 RepID=UPI0036DDA60F